MLLEFIGLAALTASIILAFGWGGRDEQLTAAAIATATLLSWLLDNQYNEIQRGVLAIDILLLVGLFALAMTSDRFWPMYAAAFQFVGTVVHLASGSETGDFAWAYAVGLIFWSYAVMLALGIGTWLEGRWRSDTVFR